LVKFDHLFVLHRSKNAIAAQQERLRLELGILFRRIIVKKTYLSIAAAAVISIAGVTAGFAAELPSYEATGLPISSVQVRVLGAANVREQTPVPASTVTPLQRSVLTPRAKMTTATAAPGRTETAGSLR
jgi:hypothetical protein